jgi:hypothetical protein
VRCSCTNQWLGRLIDLDPNLHSLNKKAKQSAWLFL